MKLGINAKAGIFALGTLGALITLGIIWSCGDKYDYNNPVDPENTKIEAGGDNKTGAGGNTSTTCLTDCNPAAGTTFTFTSSVDISPTGCTVGAARAFDTGAELLVFSKANCGTRYQVYAQKFSYAGSASGAAVQLSDCASGVDGVVEFSASRATASSLVSFTCKNSSSSYVTKVVPLTESSMSAGSVNTYDTQSSQPSAGTFALSWNSTASAFGYARSNLFQRFGPDGSQIGGAVTLNHYYQPNVTEMNGVWYVISGHDYSELACSKISASGNLQCNRTVSDISTVATSGEIITPLGFISTTVFLGLDYSYSYNRNRIVRLEFDNSLCAFSYYDQFPEPNEKRSEGLSPIFITQNNTGIAYKSSSNRLVFGVTSGSSFRSETPILNGDSTLANIEAKSVAGKIYVFYSLAGKSYFVKSNESVN